MPNKFPAFFASKEIKKSEKGRINPAYCNVNEIEKLVNSVPYIWVINEIGEIIIGIEQPWRYPEAFNVELNSPTQRVLWDMIANQLIGGVNLQQKKPDALGHPTIAVQFSGSEKLGENTEGACCLGGDLYYDRENEKWILNNRSGRFGRKNAVTVEEQKEVEEILKYSATIFINHGFIVKPLLYFHRVNTNFTSTILGGSTKELCEIEVNRPTNLTLCQ